MRATVAIAVDYGVDGIERGEDAAMVPSKLLTRTRSAARAGVSLDTVLRCYFAGYTLFRDLLIEEAEKSELMQGAALRRLLDSQAQAFDCLLAAVSEEHARQTGSPPGSPETRRTRRIEQLLAGESLDHSELAYRLDDWHLGVLAVGQGAEQVVRELAGAMDRRLLLVHRTEGAIWVWLGGRLKLEAADLMTFVSSKWPASAALAIGEPAKGISGWRLTHRQAAAALPIALHGEEKLVRYADIALPASILRDDLLATTLRRLYLDPLAAERDGGKTARETLRAYFAAERNVSSAAAALGVNRNTVASRLLAIEDRIGCPLGSCAAELELALRVQCLGDPATSVLPLALR